MSGGWGARAGGAAGRAPSHARAGGRSGRPGARNRPLTVPAWGSGAPPADLAEKLEPRSEEHTSELQSLIDLVCRLLLEKKSRGGALNRNWRLAPLRVNSAGVPVATVPP